MVYSFSVSVNVFAGADQLDFASPTPISLLSPELDLLMPPWTSLPLLLLLQHSSAGIMPPSPLPMDALLILQSLSQRLLTPWRPSLGPVRSLAISALPGSPWKHLWAAHTKHSLQMLLAGGGIWTFTTLAVTFLPSTFSVKDMSSQLLHTPIFPVSHF